MATNLAAVLPSKQAYPFTMQEAPMPTPKTNQVTIRVHAVAINPVDMASQVIGLPHVKYPCIFGCDCAGIVTAIGSAITEFAVGDRVCGCIDVDDQAEGQGTFQKYVNLTETLVGKISDGTTFAEAAVLPLGMCAAAVGLFEKDNLKLGLPSAVSKAVSGKAVLVWGGSSSVGSCAIQAAKSAGYVVAATAGQHNLEYCKSLGADFVFDHRSGSVVEDVVAALKSKEFCGVFAAVMGEDVYVKSAEICVQLGGVQMVSTVLPPFMPYEKPLPGDVKLVYNWGAWLRDTQVGPAIWHDWVPGALTNGSLKCKPGPDIVGQGLEKIQEAVDMMKSGASAQKFVVEIP